jgi:hypothetical protein
MSDVEISEALRGPWVAVLADHYGFLLEPEEITEDDEVEVSVVRDTAVPVGNRCPGSHRSGDVLFEHDGYWVDEDDDSISLRTRWEQAQAVAAALNVPVGSSGSSSGDAR